MAPSILRREGTFNCEDSYYGMKDLGLNDVLCCIIPSGLLAINGNGIGTYSQDSRQGIDGWMDGWIGRWMDRS